MICLPTLPGFTTLTYKKEFTNTPKRSSYTNAGSGDTVEDFKFDPESRLYITFKKPFNVQEEEGLKREFQRVAPGFEYMSKLQGGKTFAYVKYATKEDAQAAMEALSDTPVEGQVIKIKTAEPPVSKTRKRQRSSEKSAKK